MEIRALYDMAKQRNIEVLTCPMPENGSMSVMTDSGDCFVGMDPGVRDSGTRERVHLAHELGHCVTGSFYNIHAAIDHRQRHDVHIFSQIGKSADAIHCVHYKLRKLSLLTADGAVHRRPDDLGVDHIRKSCNRCR